MFLRHAACAWRAVDDANASGLGFRRAFDVDCIVDRALSVTEIAPWCEVGELMSGFAGW